MQAGLIAAYDAVEIFAAASASAALSDTGNGVVFQAGLTTGWCPNGAAKAPFVEIVWTGSIAVTTGVVSGTLSVSIPPLGIGPVTVSAAALVAQPSASVRLDDFRLYQRAAAWYATWSNLTVTLGATAHTFGSGNIAGPRLAPTGVPFLGVPPTLAASIAPTASQAAGEIPGQTVPFSKSYQGACTCSGGYHVKELGSASYVAFPVSLSVLLGGTTGCPCEPTLLPTASAADTATGLVTAAFAQTRTCVYRGRFSCRTCPDGQTALVPAQWDVWDTTAEQQVCSASLTLLPNLPKSVRRLAPDYAALIFRSGLPQTTAGYTDSCFDYVSDVNTGNVQERTLPHPRESAFLGVVSDAPHVIEAPMSLATLAPYGWGASRLLAKATASVSVSPGVCPLGEGGGTPIPCFPVFEVACEGSRASAFPTLVDDAIANPDLAPGLYHDDPLARYVDTWSAPHWNYAYWFPPNVDSGPLQPWEWPVDHRRANPTQYWLPARTQWLWNPLLPTSEAKRTRTDLMSAPLADGSLAGFWRTFWSPMTNLTCPWGVCRFIAEPVTLPATLDTNAAVWSFTGATAVFGLSAITLTPSATTCVAELSLGSFTNPPYQTLALAVSVLLGWSGASITAVVIDLVGVDGAIVPLATAPGAYPWPRNPVDLKYAGTWGQDFGVGFITTDTGADALSTGISSAEMASVENAYAFQLAYGYTAAMLRFTFTLADTTHPVNLDTPVFTLPTAPTVVQETGDTAAILYPNGPGVRFGLWSWWTSAWQDPPAVRPFGHTSTALDWLAYRRVALSGLAADSGLDAEIAGLYDGVEQTSRDDLATDTVSFIAVADGKLCGVLVNALAEVPPLAIFPVRARDLDLQPTGAFALESWSHAKGPRDLVSAHEPADLVDTTGVTWTSPHPGPAGWAIRRHDHPVTNAEDATCTVRSNGVTYAHASPWHGYTCVLFPSAGASPRIVQSAFGELHLAYIDAGDIHYRWSPYTTPEWQFDTAVTSDGGWSSPRMTLDHRGRIELRADRAGTAYRFVSDDNGRTWSTPTAIP